MTFSLVLIDLLVIVLPVIGRESMDAGRLI